MTTFRAQIKNVVAGDDLEVLRTVQNIPATMTLSQAWLTVKEEKAAGDLAAVFQLEITPTPGTDGQITDTGSDGTGEVTFFLSAAQTILCTPEQTYHYDIQVKTTAGKIYTVEVGTIRFKQGITGATT